MQRLSKRCVGIICLQGPFISCGLPGWPGITMQQGAINQRHWQVHGYSCINVKHDCNEGKRFSYSGNRDGEAEYKTARAS